MPTVSELKERARGFEQRGELATALKVYRHILTHLEGTPAITAEIPLYVKIGDLSAKLGAGVEAVEMYQKAAMHYATAGSARSLMALALKVQRVDPARGGVYGQFARDLLAQGHDAAATEVLREAADRSGLARLRAALSWAGERPEDEARGVLVRLADALAQSGDAVEREAEAITAPPEEPLRVERIAEAEPPVMWSPDAPEGAGAPPPGSDDLRLETDRWGEAIEQVPESPSTEAPPPPATPELLDVLPVLGAGPAPLDIEPLVGMPAALPPAPPAPPAPAAPPAPPTPPAPPAPAAPPPAPLPPPVEAREPELVPAQVSARRSAPFGRILVEERRHRRGKRWLLAAGAVVIVAGAAGAVALNLVPLGSGRDQAGGPAVTPEDAGAPAADTGPGSAAAEIAPAPSPVIATRDISGSADTTARGDTALAPPRETPLPPVPVPVDVPPAVVPRPVAPLDTTPRGPPVVRVPGGTTIRDLLIVVEGLAVESAVPLDGRRGHRVVQRLADGEPLVLTATPMTGSDTVGISDVRITVAGDTTVGSVRFWSFRVTARARADADTVARLLRRLVRARPVN